MGKFLRLAGSDTKRLTIGDDADDYIDVKADISKREFVNLVSSFPGTIGDDDTNFTIAQAMEFQQNLFEALVVGWSVTDEKGKPLPATVDNYLTLSRDAAEAVDTAVSEHFNALNPSKDEASKST